MDECHQLLEVCNNGAALYFCLLQIIEVAQHDPPAVCCLVTGHIEVLCLAEDAHFVMQVHEHQPQAHLGWEGATSLEEDAQDLTVHGQGRLVSSQVPVGLGVG